VADLLPGLPRYLAALMLRLDRLRGAGPRRDGLDAATIGSFESRLVASGLAPHDPRARRLRVLIEELHVATFADRLGTSEPISPSRLERSFDEVVASRGW
jgi:ATP-dependent helicase HrpA